MVQAKPLPARREATYQDVLDAPEHMVAEIIDGELYLSPRPASRHARAAAKMSGDLIPAFDGPGGGDEGEPPGGWWLLFEPELHFGKQVMVPDLAGWRRERMPEFPDVAYFTLAPDWVCEVASPGSARIDRLRKMPRYADAGVRHVWIVDPIAQSLEVYRLGGDGRYDLMGGGGADERVRVEPFEGLEIGLAGWWV